MVGGDNAIGLGDEATTFKMSDPLIKAVLDSVEAAGVTLHAGITTAREIGSRDYIDVYLRAAQAAGQIEAPRILATGPGVFMTGGHGNFWQPDRAADGVAEVVKRVRELVHNKVDVIKVVSADGPETLGRWTTVQSTPEEIAAAFTEAKRLGRRTASHAMGPDAIRNVVLGGGDTVEHGWYLTEESCRLMAERGTYLIPTLGNVVDIIHKGPSLQMPWTAMMAEDEPAIFERHAMAVELGVKIAMGSDCGGNEARQQRPQRPIVRQEIAHDKHAAVRHPYLDRCEFRHQSDKRGDRRIHRQDLYHDDAPTGYLTKDIVQAAMHGQPTTLQNGNMAAYLRQVSENVGTEQDGLAQGLQFPQQLP